MLTSIAPESLTSLQNFVRIGRVAEVTDASHILVVLEVEGHAFEMWSSFAMGNMPLPHIDDKVLIAGENLESGFIVGLFPSEYGINSYTIGHDHKSKKTTLTIPDGDLDLRSNKGSINIQAAKGVSINSSEFTLDSAKGNIKITEANYQGLKLGATVERTKLLLGKVTSKVGRIIEKAKNVYRQVDNLNQIKAGRMKTVISGSYHLKSERIVEKAEKEVSIDGEKINLG